MDMDQSLKVQIFMKHWCWMQNFHQSIDIEITFCYVLESQWKIPEACFIKLTLPSYTQYVVITWFPPYQLDDITGGFQDHSRPFATFFMTMSMSNSKSFPGFSDLWELLLVNNMNKAMIHTVSDYSIGHMRQHWHHYLYMRHTFYVKAQHINTTICYRWCQRNKSFGQIHVLIWLEFYENKSWYNSELPEEWNA